jgi:hypothetical protein
VPKSRLIQCYFNQTTVTTQQKISTDFPDGTGGISSCLLTNKTEIVACLYVGYVRTYVRMFYVWMHVYLYVGLCMYYCL